MKKHHHYDLVHTVYVPRRSDLVYCDWCLKHFGRQYDLIEYREGTWTVMWAGPDRMRDYEFRFKNSRDAFLFKLRWS